MLRAAVVALALAAALVPIPAWIVDRYYSTRLYADWQGLITTVSNTAPFALFDAFVIVVAGAWLILTLRDIVRWRARGAGRTVLRLLARAAVWAALVYLMFFVSWGLNYQRVRLIEKLELDDARVTDSGVRALASLAVVRLNALHSAAHAKGWPEESRIDPALAAAFVAAQRDLGATRLAVPGRPKTSLLDLYFRRAVVDGMTDPFFLETLVVSDLLPFERAFVTAHEWAHLAGHNDEGEANFVGWLTCMRGDEPRQYSGWLFLFNEAASQMPRQDRQELSAKLADGPRADLRAISDRVARNRSARMAETGWQVYNQYLKANRVESGTASYGEVIRLVLGTRFNPSSLTLSR